MNEILDGTPRLKTPMATCYFSGPVTASLADRVAKSLVHFPLKPLVLDSSRSDDFDAEIDVLEDLVRLAPRPARAKGWVLRLDKAVMQRFRVHPHAVEVAVQRFSPAIECYVSEEAMPVWECKICAVGDVAALAQAIVDHVVVQGGSNAITGASTRNTRVSLPTAAGGVVETTARVIETDGSDVRSLLYIDGLDPTRIVTNDIVECIETLGIEIGLAVLRYELKKVLMFDGGYINERHIDLLCHTMCFEGYLRPVSRHGLARQEHASFLTRASFEESMEVLADGALWNLSEPVGQNVTSSIMFGRVAPVGTGKIQLVPAAPQQQKPKPMVAQVPLFRGKKRRAPDTVMTRHWDFYKDPLRVFEEVRRSHATFDPGAVREGEWWGEEEDEVDPWAEAPGAYDALPGDILPSIVVPLATTTFPLDDEEDELEEEQDDDNMEPRFVPCSPQMIEVQSCFEPASPRLEIDSPQYDPNRPPESPQYDPNRPPDSPQYDPNKPPESPQYNPNRPPDSPQYDPNKPPESPQY